MASTEFYTDLDLKSQQIKNARIENVTSLPDHKVGRVVYLTADVETNKKGFYYSTGTEWIRVTIKSETDAIITDVNALKAAVGTGTDGTTLAGRVTALETTVNGAGEVVGLVAKVSTNASEISTLKTETIPAVRATAADAQTRVGVVEGKVATLETDVGKLKTDMGKAQTDITDLEGLVGTTADLGLRGDVKALKSTVGDGSSGLVKDVADNKGAIASINGEISALKTADSNEKTAREQADAALDTRVKDLEDAGYITKDVSDLTNYYKKEETLTATEVQGKIDKALSSAYTVKGSLSAAEITNSTAEGKKNGYVYNVTTDFILDGVKYPAGTNIVWVVDEGGAGSWDVLAGLGNFDAYAKTTDVESKISTAKSEAIADAKTYTNTEVGKKVDKSFTLNSHALSGESLDLTKADIGLGNVDNTADADKPISTATQAVLNKKVNTLTTPQADGTTYAKVVLDGQGLVKTGYAKITKTDIDGTIDASQITNFETEVISAGKIKIGPTLLGVNVDWTSIGDKDITEIPSAITAYDGTGAVIGVALRYYPTAKRIQYQVNESVTATIVVSL